MSQSRTMSRGRASRRTQTAGYWWYLMPLAVGFLLVIAVPFVLNLWFSLHDWSGVGSMTFVGLANYVKLAHDAVFWTSFRNSLAFIVAMAVLPTIVGVTLSAALFDFVSPRFGAKLASFLRATYYLPQILPIAVAGVLWKWMYQPDYGVINAVLAKFGIGAQNWLGSSDLALLSVMNVMIWLQVGYTVVLFMAGMSRIDPALHEAAELDGAGWWQRFRVVTLNELRPEIAVVLITTSVAALKVFAPVFVLTKGGPGTSTMVPSYFSFSNFFTTNRVGYGSAVASVLAVIVTIIALAMLYYQSHTTEGLD